MKQAAASSKARFIPILEGMDATQEPQSKDTFRSTGIAPRVSMNWARREEFEEDMEGDIVDASPRPGSSSSFLISISPKEVKLKIWKIPSPALASFADLIARTFFCPGPACRVGLRLGRQGSERREASEE